MASTTDISFILGGISDQEDLCFADPVPEGVFCGDCWKNKASRKLCILLFLVFCIIFALTVFLMSCYHWKRKQA